MKRTIRLSESQLHSIIKESVNRVLMESGDSREQWEDEIAIFFRGLNNGDFVELGDKSIGVEWGHNDKDPRFIVFEYGDNRLRDDHFYMQHSRRLTDNELKDIRDILSAYGIVERDEFDMDYGLYGEEY